MARPTGRVGVIGAVMIMVGLVLAGAGFVIDANAESSSINCQIYQSNNCQSTLDNDENTSIDTGYLTGIGFIFAGVGVAMVVFALIGIMAGRLEPPAMPPSPPIFPVTPGWSPPPPAPPRYP